jgi:phosphoglycolate phosphatase
MYKNEPLDKKPVAIVFDLSGTLIDSQSIDHEALNHVLSAYDLPPWSVTRNKRDSSKSIKENFPVFFGSDASDEAYSEYVEYLLAHKHAMCLFDGALDVLQYLKNENIPVIIISNRDRTFVMEMMKEFCIEVYVTVAIAAGDTVYYKPDPRLFEFALDAANITLRGDEILFIGDSLADMACADNSKSFPVLLRAVKTDVTDEWIEQAANANKKMWVVKDFPELLSLLKGNRTK